MKIGIDCRLWSTPTGRHIRENVKRIVEKDSQNTYVLFFLSKDIAEFDAPKNVKKVVADVAYHTFLEQIKMPFIFMRESLDLLHVPYFNVPLFYPKKFTVTIHDLTILRTDTGRASTKHPLVYMLKRLGFRLALFYAVFRSTKIITVSNYVKQDLVKTFRVSPEKIKVIYNGVSSEFKRESAEKVLEVLRKYSVKKPYLFYVGNAHPHKNVENLIKAFDLVSKSMPDLHLVIAGKKDFFVERLMDEFSGLGSFSKIIFTGFVEDSDLPVFYSGAEAFVYPSFSEGFGMQVLEAFSCETKVICSNTTSLPEVGGDAAYYFDPKNVQNMAEVILQTLADNSGEKIKLGLERKKVFNWDKSAEEHLLVLHFRSSF